jgi:tetrahydromethanopterin S-methyltransferase subunit H
MEILRGFEGQVGLLRRAEEAGIKKTLVDVAVLDVPSIGLAMKAIYSVKEETGLPTGCGPSNATSTWKRLRKGELGADAVVACEAAANAVTIPMGANFILYGPIENSGKVFPAVALTDALVAYHARRLGIRVRTRNHPLFKIFP